MGIPKLEMTPTLETMYAHYGIASHFAHNIEKRLVLLLLGPEWVKHKPLTSDKIEKIYETLNKDTLGGLVKRFNQCGVKHSELRERLKYVLKKRNYLIHHFFGSRDLKIYEQKIQEEMIKELKEIVNLLASANAFFEHLAMPILEDLRLTNKTQQELAKLSI